MTEEEIIKEVLKGNINTYAEIIKKYKNYIYNLGMSIFNNYTETEDFTQEVFIKLYKNLKKYKSNFNFKTWLYKIAINTAKDFLRKKKFLPVSLEDHKNLIYSEDKVEESIQKNLESQMLLSLIRTLPEKYLNILILRYIENLSYEEIAEVTSKPIGTVKTLLFRAKLLLAKKLKIQI
ncbi:MAG: sigma-70 family RNA polymerase sigma factor [Endomicrobiia bacterium]